MSEYFCVRRLPLAALYRKTVRLGLECGECGARFTVDYDASRWRGRRGECPICRRPQRLRPADLRAVLEKSFRRAARRIETRNISHWNDAFAFTIARASIALEPLLMVVIVHFYHQRIGHYATNTSGFLWRLEDDGYGEALLFAMPPNPATESNHYFRQQVGRRFIITPAAIPAFHLVEKKTNPWARLNHRWREFRIRSKGLTEKQVIRATWGASRPLGHAVEFFGDASNVAQWIIPHWLNPSTRSSFVSFTSGEHDRARDWFKKVGLDPDAPYACFYDRDINYLNTQAPGKDYSYHLFHYMNVDTYIPAMNWLADQGITCLRMGKYPGRPLSLERPGVVDYASLCQDDFMDIYLPTHCAFGISNGCGMDMLLVMAKKWLLQVNMVLPFNPSITFLADNYWAIMKKLWSHDKHRYLSYREVYENRIESVVDGKELFERHISVVDNTPAEILAAVQEFYARFTGTWTPDDREEEVHRYCQQVMSGRYGRHGIKGMIHFCHGYVQANPHFLEGSGIKFS